ncbi:MAG: cupin domain-containing protein [Nitrospirota bacterium]
MALHHASSGERIDIRPLRDALNSNRSTTLYKSEHLEVFRLVLIAGKGMPEHRVTGEITVQCLEDRIAFSIASASEVMRQGDLKYLSGGEPHALMAIEDSSVLVTLLLHGISAGQ